LLPLATRPFSLANSRNVKLLHLFLIVNVFAGLLSK
jgi:hypothetical protein